MANGTLAASQIEMESQSGTGITTIVPPATNTDRTLTLPDAAGVMYAQGNILGTVSESSGVPTGAIIERGSNANGRFERYADGTMICTRTVSHNLASTSSQSWSYPSSFFGTPNGGLSGITVSAFGPVGEFYAGGGGAATGASAWSSRNGSAGTGTISIDLSAIGRWF